MAQEIPKKARKCHRILYKKVENSPLFRKVRQEYPCPKKYKKRCDKGILQYDGKDGRKAGEPCKDDLRYQKDNDTNNPI